MSAYDYEIQSRIKKNSLFAMGVIKQLEKDYNIKIDDNHKAHLIGQLSLSASLEGLTVYANKVSKSFAFEFFQEMIAKGIVSALTPVTPVSIVKEIKPETTKKPEGLSEKKKGNVITSKIEKSGSIKKSKPAMKKPDATTKPEVKTQSLKPQPSAPSKKPKKTGKSTPKPPSK